MMEIDGDGVAETKAFEDTPRSTGDHDSGVAGAIDDGLEA